MPSAINRSGVSKLLRTVIHFAQRGLQKQPDGNCDENGDYRIDDRDNGFLGDDGQHCGEREAKQKEMLDKTFGKIEKHVGKRAAEAAEQTAPAQGQAGCRIVPRGVLPQSPVPSIIGLRRKGRCDFSADPCHEEFESEGEGGGGQIGGIRQVKKHGANAGGKPAAEGPKSSPESRHRTFPMWILVLSMGVGTGICRKAEAT